MVAVWLTLSKKTTRVVKEKVLDFYFKLGFMQDTKTSLLGEDPVILTSTPLGILPLFLRHQLEQFVLASNNAAGGATLELALCPQTLKGCVKK